MGGSGYRITVLVENTVGVAAGLIGEFGQCLLIETEGGKILFDTGGRGWLVNNALALGIDLKTVDALVMSHGHFDHSGGMQAFLRLRGRLPVYAHPDFFAPRFNAAGKNPYIGVPFCREELVSSGADFVFTQEPAEIRPGVWVSGEVPRKTDFEPGDSRLYTLRGEERMADPFRDDMSIYCVTPLGLLVVVGCAHAGLVNIIEHGREVTGLAKVYGVLGGTHLGMVPPAQQENTIAYLRNLSPQFIAANHCTGLAMIVRLASLFGPVFRFAPAGAGFTLPAE
ncbi:MAG: MBL fold metallo-hydrolase [Peptococcaceae bacterium]|jgi:7,8-dihydropterin-6-yl-methyl-4-(beta-D-ribofuranosyl)aminobenzene 5'-phosphate synthase|nr:MBL fold metallo-hydrolase [Peptococcaceae bacterium]